MDAQDKKMIEGGMFLLMNMDFREVFTPEDFTSEHRDVARAIEEFIQGEIISLGDEMEKLDNQLSRNLMKKAGELGFLGIDIPEKYGGMELDKISSALGQPVTSSGRRAGIHGCSGRPWPWRSSNGPGGP